MGAISLNITFSAGNDLVISKVNNDLRDVSNTLTTLSTRATTSTVALRAFQAEVNRTANLTRTQLGGALDFVGNGFSRFYSIVDRIAKVGLAALTTQLIGSVYAIKKLGQEFLSINEQFSGLEITLKSAFNSVTIAKQLRESLTVITASSPIPFKDLADLTRAASVIPFTRSQIAQQAVSPAGLSDPNGFLNKFRQLVEKMIAFRPDRSEADAVFSLRQALSGEFRSLIRRFSIPTSAITASADGATFDQVKADPAIAFKAINKFFSGIITPEAVAELIKQPSKLFANLLEQLFEIPLVKIGQSGLYDKVINSFVRLYDGIVEFVTNGIEPYAKRISDAIGKIFGKVSGISGGAVNNILGHFGQGETDRPGVGLPERFFGAVSTAAERAGDSLPKLIDGMVKFFSIIIPALETFGKYILKLVESVGNIFNKAPTATLVLGGLAYSFLPSIISGIRNSVTTAIAEASARGLAQSVASNAAIAARSIPINRSLYNTAGLGALQSATQPGIFATLFGNAGTLEEQALGSQLYRDSRGNYQIPAGVRTSLRGTGPTRIPLNQPVPVGTAHAEDILARSGVNNARLGIGGAVEGALQGLAAAIGPMVIAMLAFGASVYLFGKYVDAVNRANENAFAQVKLPIKTGLVSQFSAQANQDYASIQAARSVQGESDNNTKFAGATIPFSYTGIDYTPRKVEDETGDSFKNATGLLVKKHSTLDSFYKEIESVNSQYLKIADFLKDPNQGELDSALGHISRGDKTEADRQLNVLLKFIRNESELLKLAKKAGLVGVQDLNRPKDSLALSPDQNSKLGEAREAIEASGFLNPQKLVATKGLEVFDRLNQQTFAAISEENYALVSELSTYEASVFKKHAPGVNAAQQLETLLKAREELDKAVVLADKAEYENYYEGQHNVASRIRSLVTETKGKFKSPEDRGILVALEQQFKDLDVLAKSLDSGSFDLKQVAIARASINDKQKELADGAANLFSQTFDSFIKETSNYDQITGQAAVKDIQPVLKQFLKFRGFIGESAEKMMLTFNELIKGSLANPNLFGEAADIDKLHVSKNQAGVAGLLNFLEPTRLNALNFSELTNAAGNAGRVRTNAYSQYQQSQAYSALGAFGNAGSLGTSLGGEALTAQAVSELTKAMAVLKTSIPNEDIEKFQILFKDSTAPRDVQNLIDKYKVLNPVIDKIIASLQEQKRVAESGKDPEKDKEVIQQTTAAIAQLNGVKQQYFTSAENLVGSGFFQSFADGFKDVTEQWRVTASNMKSIGSDLANSFSSNFDSAFGSFIDKTKTASEAFSNFGLDLLRTAAKMLADKAFKQLIGLVTDIAVNAVGGIASSGASSGVSSTLSSLGFTSKSLNTSAVNPSLKSLAVNPVAYHTVASNTINISVSGTGTTETSKSSAGQPDAGESQRALARQIRSAVLSVIDEQSRTGGRFKANGSARS